MKMLSNEALMNATVLCLFGCTDHDVRMAQYADRNIIIQWYLLKVTYGAIILWQYLPRVLMLHVHSASKCSLSISTLWYLRGSEICHLHLDCLDLAW